MSGYIGTQPVPQSTQTRDSFTATSGQTSFATGGYQSGYIDLYLNGIKLAAADYTATNNSDVVLAVGATTGDILEVVAYTAFNTANVTGAVDFTVTNNIVVGGTVDGVDIAARDAVLTATTTTANAALPKSGGAVTGNVTFGDSNKAIFGAGSELQVYHNGTHSFVANTTGDMNLQTTGAMYLTGSTINLYDGSTTRLAVASSGNVGIGLTSNISSKLHVNSEVSLGPDNNNRMIVGSTSGGVGSIGTIQGGTASFGTMTFKSGNVGIGCTPEAWNTSHKVLRTGTRTSLANTTGGSGESTYLANNYYNNGAAELYLETGAVSVYTQSVGKHNFQVAASGTAGAALTLTTAMTIDNAGIVTTPSQPYFYRITVPVTGNYLVGFHMLSDNQTNAEVSIRVNGSNIPGSTGQNQTDTYDNFSVQNIVNLAANDYIQFYVASGRVHGNSAYNRMYVYKLG